MSAYYQHDSNFFSKRAIVFLAILAFHVLIIWAFISGLASSGRALIQTILQTNIIQTEKQKELPPPPPKADLKLPPPVQVIAPEVNISVPVDTPPPMVNVAPKRAPPAPAPIHIPPAPIVAPRVTYAPDPQDYYPDESRRNNEEGRALVHICIDVRGRVAAADVSSSAGHPLLDQAAIKLAKATRFKPATQRGKPVQYCTGLPVKFVLTAGGG